MRRTIVWAATGMLGSIAGAGTVSAVYCPHPARDFSAYYYRSPGGIGPPRRPSVYVGKAAPRCPASPELRQGAVVEWRALRDLALGWLVVRPQTCLESFRL
jgi:hypothetical protein